MSNIEIKLKKFCEVFPISTQGESKDLLCSQPVISVVKYKDFSEDYCVNISKKKDSYFFNLNIENALKKKWLNEAELIYLESCKSSKRKCEFVLGRIAAKSALINLIESYIKLYKRQILNSEMKFTFPCDIDPKKISIIKTKEGYPIVKIENLCDFNNELNIDCASSVFFWKSLKVSVSHSKNYAAAIACNSNFSCGVDIECVNEKNMKIISNIVSENEPINTDNAEELTIAWSLKEALSKALLCGFSKPFENFKISELKKIENDDSNVENNNRFLYGAKYANEPKYAGVAYVIEDKNFCEDENDKELDQKKNKKFTLAISYKM